MATRETWRIDRAGSLDRLTRRIESLPELPVGQARIAVKAIGLNFADIFACQGLYSATPKGSFIPGLEFAGVVEAVRSETDVSNIQAGDRVAGLTRFGAYATIVDVPIGYVRPVRPGWDFAEGAALPAQGLTAWYGLLRLARVQRGEVVLVQSAAGGVGLNALAILESLGARTIGVVGGEHKREWLRQHRAGATEQVIVRDRRSFGAQLDEALSSMAASGLDVAFDAVGGPFFRPAYDRLRPEGRMVLYGAAGFMQARERPNYLRLGAQYLRRPRLDPLAMIAENRSVFGFNLIWLWDRIDQLAPAWTDLDRLITSPPTIGRRFPFGEAPAAMRYLQSGASIGKIILET